MACPYFFPIAKDEEAPRVARAPLGAVYRGACDLGRPGTSDACNFGYARGICEVFPADTDSDAVRFTRLGDRTIFILERDGAPIRHGDAKTLAGTLARQAEVFNAWAAK